MNSGLSNRKLAAELNATEHAVRKARASGRLPAVLFTDGRCTDLAGAKAAWVDNAARPTTTPRPEPGCGVWPADEISAFKARGNVCLAFGAAERDPDGTWIYELTPQTAAGLALALATKATQAHNDIPDPA